METPRISRWTMDRLPPFSVTGDVAIPGYRTPWQALSRFLAWRSPHTIFLLGRGGEAAARMLASGHSGDFLFMDTGGPGDPEQHKAGGGSPAGRLHRLPVNGGTFDFSGYFEKMDMVICLSPGSDSLLKESMHAFQMLRPEGAVVWVTPDPIPAGVQEGFETISRRFPLIRFNDADLTFYVEDADAMALKSIAPGAVVSISVIIPTCNGGPGLSRTLHSVLDQTLSEDRYEIIVVDNNSSDSTRAVVEQLNQACDGRIRYLFEPNPGLVYARHAGARAATGGVLSYIDDDAIAESAWLEAIARAFDDPEVALVGGKILPEYETDPPDWLESLWIDCPSGRHLGELSLMDLGDKPGSLDPGHVWGCNFSIRRQLLFDAGGFHPDALPRGLIRHRGDGEGGLSRKIGKLGHKAFYQPGAVVRHHIPASRLTVAYFLKRRFNQGISDSFTRIRENGAPEDARIHGPLLERVKGFVRHPGSFGPDPEHAPPSHGMDLLLREAYEYGRLFHLFHVFADPELGAYVRQPDYFSPDILKPVDLESIDLPERTGGNWRINDYKYGLWLMEQGLYHCARIVLDQVKASGGAIKGLDWSRAFCLAQYGQEAEAEQAALCEPLNSPFRDGAEDLLKQIKGDRVRRRTEQVRSLTPESLDIEQMPLAMGMAVIYITEMCNSRCITCNSWQNRSETRLGTAAWKGILGQIRSAGIPSVAFVGGEPLLRPDLPKLVEEANRLRFSTILVSTNGFLLNPSRTDALIAAGANAFHLSLDGGRETYRRIRGRDWFDRVVGAARYLSGKGADLLLLTILMRQNLEELEQIIAFAHGIGAKWFPNILENGKYLFKGVDTGALAISDQREIDQLAGKLETLKARYPRTMEIGKPEIDYIRRYLENPRWESRIPCTLGFDAVYLDPSANIYPSCMSLKPVGNLIRTDLADLLQSETMKARLWAMVRRKCPGCTCGYPQRARDAYCRKKDIPLNPQNRLQTRYWTPEESRCNP